MASDLFSIDSEFDRNRHVRFLDMMYDLLPSDYQSQEINHLTLAYFTLSSLDILGSLDQVYSSSNPFYFLFLIFQFTYLNFYNKMMKGISNYAFRILFETCI